MGEAAGRTVRPRPSARSGKGQAGPVVDGLDDNCLIDMGSVRMKATASRLTVLGLAIAGLGGCASLDTTAANPAAAPAAAPAPAAAAPNPAAAPGVVPGVAPRTPVPGTPTPVATAGTPTPQAPGMPAAQPPGTPPPFPQVIKDARRIDGVITAWQKDDKLWLELRPEDLGKPFLFTPKIRSGIGEGLLVGGLMTYPLAGAGGAQVVEFVRVNNTIRLQARNTDIVATAGTPEALATQSTYSHSLLGATPVASQPHPDRKSVLIDVSAMFVSDLSGLGMHLQRQFRQGYSLDPRNSLVTGVRGTDDALIIETQTHWFTGAVSSGAPLNPLAALMGAQAPTVPRWVPDTRSFLIGQHLSFTPLPATPMATRRADPRVGLFSTRVMDFSDDLSRTPVRRYVARWRLEKKDPAAERSEPVKPITFWIDRTVPLAYRETVRAAILEWNKAFDRIGFINAIRVEQQPDDASFDTMDPGYPSVRWLMSAEPSITAIGQTQMDPRSGEIVDADISFEGMFTRAQRYARAQMMAARQPAQTLLPGALLPGDLQTQMDPAAARAGAAALPAFAEPITLPGLLPTAAGEAHPGHEWCSYADQMAEQARYALDVLDARGELEPGSPLAQQFVLDYVKDTVMHEVGHALGLRHNFRASRAYTEAQLADPEFTRANGTTGSVMEYNAINLARPGEHGGVPFQMTLGPYDYWAIEYAYKPLPPGGTAADEEKALQAVAARGNEPLLAYGTDEDALFGIDAETIQFDLGADPLAFAAKRLAIARDLFRRQESRTLPADQDYSVLRRSLSYAFNDAVRAIGVLVRQLGGLRTLRDYPGSGRDPIEPVSTAVQRQAFEAIVSASFAPDAFHISPALQRRLAPDYLDRIESAGQPTDVNLPQRVLDLQRAVLAYLLSDQLAVRLQDANAKLDEGAPRLDLADVHERLMRELWAELGAAATVSAPRRELQREHVNRLALAVLRPGLRADARGLLRRQAQTLLARLDGALARRPARSGNGNDDPTRLHWADSADTLRESLNAKLPRAGL